MQKMRILIIFIALLISSIQDIRDRCIDIRILFIGSLLYGIMSIIEIITGSDNTVIYRIHNNVFGTFNMLLLIRLFISLIPGIFFIFLPQKLKGIGEGDGWVILFIGFLQGIEVTLTTMIIAFIIVAIIALLLIILKKADLKKGLPFVPFLTLGYIICIFSRHVARI